MPHFSKHMSEVVAAATVHGPDAMANCIKAFERNGEARLECLREARDDLERWFADLDAAIAHVSLEIANAEAVSS